MKTFASAVAGVKDDLDDLGRDEALRFAASMSARPQSRAVPSTYQVASPDQFAKILEAAGLVPEEDYRMVAPSGRPGLVTWCPTSRTSEFIASVKPAPVFETLVLFAAGDDDSPDGGRERRYSGQPCLSPEEITTRLSSLAERAKLDPALMHAVKTGTVNGHRVVLPPMWLLERLAFANGLGEHAKGAPHTLFTAIDPGLDSLVEVPIVRHVRNGEKLHGVNLLVGAPPADLYFSPPSGIDGEWNPLQGYFYQDAEMASEVSNPSKMVVASSALLDLSGANGLSVASFLTHGWPRLGEYIEAVLSRALGLRVTAVCLSVHSNLGNKGSDLLDRFSAGPRAGMVVRGLGRRGVVVNFVAVVDSSLAGQAQKFLPSEESPTVRIKFTGYAPQIAPCESPNVPAANRELAWCDLGVLWRFATRLFEQTCGAYTYKDYEEWLKHHPGAVVDAAPTLSRPRTLLMTLFGQLRGVLEKSKLQLVSDSFSPNVLVRGVYPAMFAGDGSEWKTACGRTLGDLVQNGAFDNPKAPLSGTWKELTEMPNGVFSPAIILATNVPAKAVKAEEREKFCKLVATQAFTSFFTRSRELLSVELVDGVNYDLCPTDVKALLAFNDEAVKWVSGGGYVHAGETRATVMTDARGRLVVAVAFIRSAGRFALALVAERLRCLETVVKIVTSPSLLGPKKIHADRAGDPAAVSACLNALVGANIIEPVVDARYAGGAGSRGLPGSSPSRSDYLGGAALTL